MAVYTCEKKVGVCVKKNSVHFFSLSLPFYEKRRPIIRLYTVKLQSFSNKASPLQSHIKAAEKHKPTSAADFFMLRQHECHNCLSRIFQMDGGLD